jgi:hypothetical protein
MDASQMREQFESRFVEEYVRVLGEGARELAAHALAANSPVVSMSWWAWQASRAVVVGELQSKKHSIECRLEVSQDTLSTIRGCLRAAESDIDQLKAENEALRGLILSALEEGKGRLGAGGNAPGHCHAVPGVWDRGNGERSGTTCGWCRIWNAAQAMAKEASRG